MVQVRRVPLQNRRNPYIAQVAYVAPVTLQKIAWGHRIVIPKKLWEENGIEDGDQYDISYDREHNRLIVQFVDVVVKEAAK